MLHIKRLVISLVVMILIVSFGWSQAEAITLVSEQQEIEMGRSLAKEVERHYELVKDDALQARVQKIGMSLAAVSGRPKLPYTFKVLNCKEVNAFSLPGGFIYIYKGLVDLMPSDEELAGVIGHEIGHVVKRHAINQMEKGQLMMLASLLAFKDKAIPAQLIGMDLLMAKYSRSDEQEADTLAFSEVMKAGYNPYSTLLGMKKLSETDQSYQYDLFSDHPESVARVKAINGNLVKNKIAPVIKELDNGAAQVVDGSWSLPVLYAENNGYKPNYRAYFAAGNLYLIRKLPDYDPDKYILDSDGDNVTVYYEDRAIITLTEQDAAGQSMNLMELAGLYIARLKSYK